MGGRTSPGRRPNGRQVTGRRGATRAPRRGRTGRPLTGRGLAAACVAAFLGTAAVGWWGPQVLEALRAGTLEEQALDLWPPSGPVTGETARVARVVDGDTLVLAGGERVRILGIDAPEMPARAACEREAALALRAKARLQDLAPAGTSVTLSRGGEDRDRYGRLLRRVAVDGEDVGRQLTQEGLAQTWTGHKAQWC